MDKQSPTGESLYAVLEIPPNATDEAVRKSYRSLARRYHPDLNPGNAEAETRFKAVTQAYEILGDPEKRQKYDQRLRASGPRESEGAARSRGDDVIMFIFVGSLLIAVILFFIDSGKATFFLVVAVFLELRNRLEGVKRDLKKLRNG